jgi:hypothetical protein
MKLPLLARFFVGAFALSLLASSLGWAQLSPAQVVTTDKTLQHVKAAYAKLDARHQQMLDGYANIVHLADVWHAYGLRLTDPMFVAHFKATRRAAAIHATGASIVPVSDPSSDVAFSAFGGFTQSETSLARCGNSVVVGFNDSGSVFETPFFFTGTGGQGFSGSAFSTDGGATFSDIGPVNPGPGNGNFLGGDPGLNCSDANTFYYSQIFDFVDSNGNPFAAVAMSKSTDGGQSWGDPVAAVAKDGFNHLLDKPWSTIDPSNPKRIFVSYTDFDFSKTNSCGRNFPGRTAIEFVLSHDGGRTWTAPKVAIEVCGNAGVQASQMAVTSKGVLYISWVNVGTNFPVGIRSIQSASFKNGKVSAPVTVEPSLQPGGDSFFLQGEFRDFLDMTMAVDHSGGPTDGTLYIAWSDGRDKVVPDPLGSDGAYAYDDILLRVSPDGQNWFGPIKVNSDTQSRLGIGHDHYQAGVAVDMNGTVGICYYDRRADPENFAIRRHCGESTSQGFSWTDVDIGAPAFAPTHGNDVFLNPVYMGDYDQVTSDFLNQNPGFVGSFQVQPNNTGNPDVFVHPMN